MGKKANLNHARNMDIDAWRERQVCKRLKARLASQTQDFTDRHGAKTDEQLRELVLHRARAMGRMPHPLEMPGGIYLKRRLGDWNQLAVSLGYRPLNASAGKRAYLNLKEREAELFAEERRALKRAKTQRKLSAAERVTADDRHAYASSDFTG